MFAILNHSQFVPFHSSLPIKVNYLKILLTLTLVIQNLQYCNCKIINPINDSCISIVQQLHPSITLSASNYYSITNKTSIQGSLTTDIIQNQSLHEFQVQPYTKLLFQIDLRHLQKIPILEAESGNIQIAILKAKLIKNFNQSSSTKEVYQKINIEAEKVNKYSLFTTEVLLIQFYYQFLDQYAAYAYLFEGSIGVKIIIENFRIPEQKSSFLFIVQSQNRLNLPYNKPTIDPDYSGYYLEQITQIKTESRMSNIQSATTYWSRMDYVALPFIPYFSNCNNQSDRIFLSQMMENPQDCELVSLDNTKYISQFSFGSYPTADVCKTQRNCVYDEIPNKQTQFPYWQTLPADKFLFYITRDKIPFHEYTINKQFDNTQLVECKINSSLGTNSSNMYPLKVLLNLQYYQQSETVKKMMQCNIQYSLYVESTPNFNYQLQVQTKPMNHTNIMLAFGFQWYVYMVIFIIIGAISNLQNLILWLFHSSVSKKQKKEFRVKIYLRVIWQIAKGTFYALFLFTFLLFLVFVIMNGKIFNQVLYDTSNQSAHLPKVFWDSISTIFIDDYTSNFAARTRAGRMGFSFLIIGCSIILYMSKYFVGKQKTNKSNSNYEILGRVIHPNDYNRGKFIFGTFLFILIQFIFIYFAYSKLYSSNIWLFIVLMKILQIFIEEIIKSIYEDLLPCLPLKVITDITAYMNTLSANNFYDFLFSFLIDVAITMIQKAYISQLQNIVVQKVQQKNQEITKFYNNLINDNEVDEDSNNRENLEDEGDLGMQDDGNQVVIADFVVGNQANTSSKRYIQFFQDQIKQYYHEDEQISVEGDDTIIQLQKYMHEKLKQFKQKQNKNSQQIPSVKHKSDDTYEKMFKNKNQQQLLQKIKVKGNIQIKIDQNNGGDNQSQSLQKIQKASTIFEMLLDNIVLVFTFFLQPFVILVFWISYDESAVLGNYGISSSVIVLYMLSALVIAFFTIVNIILIFHLLQCYLQIDFQKPILESLQRFSSRSIFWKASDQDINRKIGEILRGADHYCLSWQFFFILTVYISSMILVILGISIIINREYNPYEDNTNYLIIIFWLFIIRTSIWLIQKLAYKMNIDGWADFQENRSNINAIGDLSLKQRSSYKKNGDGSTPFIVSQEEGFTNQNLLEKCSLNEDGTNKNSLAQSMKYSKKQSNYEVNLEPEDIVSMKKFIRNSEDYSDGEENESIRIQMDTICKKLENSFKDPRFCLEYFTRKNNKQHLMTKIWEIIQKMDEQLPQLPQEQTKLMVQLEQDSKSNQNGQKGYINPDKGVNSLKNQGNKNYEPTVIDLITRWKLKSDSNVRTRQNHGKFSQQKISYCQFCYEPWGLYYNQTHQKLLISGFDNNGSYKKTKGTDITKGFCLQCSVQLTNYQENTKNS